MADVTVEKAEVKLPTLREIIDRLHGDTFFGRNSETLVNVLGPLSRQLGGMRYSATRIAEILIHIAGEYAGAYSTQGRPGVYSVHAQAAVIEEMTLAVMQRWVSLLVSDGETVKKVFTALQERCRELGDSIVLEHDALQRRQQGRR